MRQKPVMQGTLNPTHDYIGRKWCGCVVAISADLGDKGTGQFVAEMITKGLTVERVPREESCRLFTWDCPHGKQPKQAMLPGIE